MAKSITQNDITFSNYNNTDALTVSSPLRYASYEGLDEDNFGIVNAIDIAWNGANFTNAPGTNTPTIINTTGLLIDAIKWASKQGSNLYEVKENVGGLLELDGSKNIILLLLSGNVSGISFEEQKQIPNGKSCDVIFKSSTGNNISINSNDNLIFPDGGDELLINVPQNGYAEINFININGIIYARGI